MVVADGAPGLIKAVEQCWPASDRQHCAVNRLRNLLAELPERERERVREAYWRALDTHAKNGVRFSQLERHHLRRIRHAGSDPTTNEEVSAA